MNTTSSDISLISPSGTGPRHVMLETSTPSTTSRRFWPYIQDPPAAPRSAIA